MKRVPICKPFEIREFCSAFPFHWDESFVFHGESHDFWEIVLVREGQVEVTEDEKVYRLQKNDLILHAPMEFHRIKSAANTSPSGFICSFCASGMLPEALRAGCFALDAEEASEYNALAERLLAFFHDRSDSPFAGQEVADALASFLIRLGSNKHPRLRLDHSQGATEYRNAVSVMTEHVCKNSSLSEIAADCRISTSYLKLLFKKYAGISPKSYYSNLRTQYAIKMLRAGVSSIQIATEMNFSSPAYFSAFFQRQTGAAPSSYRNGTE